MARHVRPRIDRLDIASAIERDAPDARARGIDYLTVRRIAELSGYPGEALPAVHDYLAHVEPGRLETPLWSTAAA